MNKTILAVFTTIMIIALAASVLMFSWAPNMEAEYAGFGILGAFFPVAAIILAFLLGLIAARLHASL
jgi:hypothetical protein